MPPSRPPTGSGSRPRAPLPAVDDRLVASESRYEIVQGVLTYVPPADEPHGVRHSKISALVEAHAKRSHEVASDMLTRTSEVNDMAPDVSVFPRGRDPKTDGRKLEEVIFEVVSTERLKHAGVKAAEFVRRGVREVYAVDVKRQRTLRWSSETAGWQMLANDGVIEDRVFATPLPIAALLDAAKVDDAMARALFAKKTPYIEQMKAELRAEGRAQGHAEGSEKGREEGREEGGLEAERAAVLAVLEARKLAVPVAVRERINTSADRAELRAWLLAAVSVTKAADLPGIARSRRRG